VVRNWYLRRTSGEAEFWFTIKNTGDIPCHATILLGTSDSETRWGTGVSDYLVPDASRSTVWSTAPGFVYLPFPLGHYLAATNSPRPGGPDGHRCEWEIAEDWYTQRPDGLREYHQTYTNVGTVQCGTEVMLVQVLA